MLLQKNPRRDL
jgi:hypothetical protein